MTDPSHHTGAPRRLRIVFDSQREFAEEYEENISNGGTFVATDQCFELREVVAVELHLEFRSESIVLPAEVVHVVPPGAGPDTMPGVALQFLMPARSLRERFEDRLTAVGRVEPVSEVGQPTEGGIHGTIEDLGLMNLLQMFGTCSRCGTLHAVCNGEDAYIVFSDGMLLGSRVGSVTGTKALARILAWREGTFEFHARLDPEEKEDTPRQLDSAIFEAVRQIDELGRLNLQDVDRSSTLCVLEANVDAEASAIEKAEQAVLDLARAGFSVGEVLDVIPEPDCEVYAALLSLMDRMLVTPA